MLPVKHRAIRIEYQWKKFFSFTKENTTYLTIYIIKKNRRKDNIVNMIERCTEALQSQQAYKISLYLCSQNKQAFQKFFGLVFKC